MSKAYYGYECKSCGQTATDQEVNVGDVLDVSLPCWNCAGEMDGYVNWDEQEGKEPKASYVNDKQIKIESV